MFKKRLPEFYQKLRDAGMKRVPKIKLVVQFPSLSPWVESMGVMLQSI